MAEELKKETAPKEVKKTDSKDNKPKEKKPNGFVRFFKRIGKFFRECHSEKKKIVWASPKSTVSSTVLVTVAIVVFAAVFFVLDFSFSKLIELLCELPKFIANAF